MFERWNEDCVIRDYPSLPDDFLRQSLAVGCGKSLGSFASYYAKWFNDRHFRSRTVPFQAVSMGLYHTTQWRRVYSYGSSPNSAYIMQIPPRIWEYV